MILAFFNRQRGMAEAATGTQAARLLYWALPILVYTTILAGEYGLPKLLGVLCGLLAWGGMAMGHSFAQSNTKTQYAEMGLICLTRLEAILLPIIVASCCAGTFKLSFLWILPIHFLLCWGASALSYSKLFQSRTLRIFGVNWCVPGDSSWEEWLVGFCYDISFCILFLSR